jgi:hypothetical protein
MMSLSSVYLEVYDELELGPALLLYDGCDGKLLHALQQATHHWGAVPNGPSQIFVKILFFCEVPFLLKKRPMQMLYSLHQIIIV